MLQKMRDQTQSMAFKVLVGILVLVLTVFGFGAFEMFGSGDRTVATVNGEDITEAMLADEVQRERRRMAARFGGEMDESLIDPLRLQGAVLEQMIARELLQQGAEALGLGMSREQVDATLVQNEAFQVNGAFQPDRYRQAVASMGFTPQQFVEQAAELLALDQLQNGVSETALVTEASRELHARLLGQRRDLAYLPFTLATFTDSIEVTEEDVALRYQENQRDYMTEETVDVAYVELSWQDLLDDPAIAISEDDLRNAYDQERASAAGEEERRSRHILLEVDDERTVAQAEAELQQLRERIEQGESFEALAREVSEDAGSAQQGGDLGFAGRGVFDPAFEEALFALEEPGQVGGPVVSDFGVHLIQLEAIRGSEPPTFEAARDEVETRLRRSQAEALFEERVRELDSLAFENPGSLEPIEQALGLPRETASGISRTTEEGLFGEESVREELFSADVLEQGFNSSALVYAPGQAVVMRVLERHEPAPIPLEEVADSIRADIIAERANVRLQEAHAAALARLQAGESSAEVAASYGVNWQRFELVTRTAPEVARPVLQAAFALPRPGAGGKSIGEADLPTGGAAVVVVTRVEDGALSSLTDAEVAGLDRLLDERAARLDFGALYQTLYEQASIRRAE